MKIVILAAGYSKYFPLFIDKPKCLYHLDGRVQLERVIEVAQRFVVDEDIIVVGGYKYRYIEEYLKHNYPKIQFRVNNLYKKAAIFSLRKAIEGINDDFVFMLADENVSERNVSRIVNSNRKMAILCHDAFYYYSVGIMKLNKNAVKLLYDNNYLSMDYMKQVYCFANNKDKYDGEFDINSGICLGYTTIDLVRRIGKINKVENPVNSYTGTDIDFFHYDTEAEYIPDIDYINDTDEYKNSVMLRIYSDYFSKALKKMGRGFKKLINYQ